MLADPANDGVSLAKVCALAGMPLARLMKLFDQVVLVKGQLKARARIAEKLPDVAAGVMEDALPGERVCLTCNGFGQFPMPTPNDKDAVATCEACLGKGTVRHQPDTDVRKLALEIGGLLTKGSGTRTMIVNQNTAAAGAVGMGAGGASGTPESFDQLMAQLDGALYGSGRDRTRRGAGSAAQASTEGEDNTVDGEVI